jgi:hypothetical protein
MKGGCVLMLSLILIYMLYLFLLPITLLPYQLVNLSNYQPVTYFTMILFANLCSSFLIVSK